MSELLLSLGLNFDPRLIEEIGDLDSDEEEVHPPTLQKQQQRIAAAAAASPPSLEIMELQRHQKRLNNRNRIRMKLRLAKEERERQSFQILQKDLGSLNLSSHPPPPQFLPFPWAADTTGSGTTRG